ncbi:MAG: hypothetical protein JW724_00060 [Candidatus Altiarchaeota archaeon]|nr:hypothetical protein [Candidatus Altiarchaeota archaeon]
MNSPKMQKSKAYFVAAVLSLSFYLFGFLSGFLLESSVTDYTAEREKSLQRQMENLQLEYAYLSMAGDLNCDSLSALVSENTEKVRGLGRALENESESFDELKREYAFISTKAWLLNSYMKEKCGDDRVVVLYFYSVPCDDCVTQGHILDDLVAGDYNGRVIVFVLNADLDEPIINMLKSTNKVSTTPALVIGSKTYNGLVKEDSLRDILSREPNDTVA